MSLALLLNLTGQSSLLDTMADATDDAGNHITGGYSMLIGTGSGAGLLHMVSMSTCHMPLAGDLHEHEARH
jgi:hypothetical protein